MDAILGFLTSIPLLGTLIGWIADGFTWIFDAISGLF